MKKYLILSISIFLATACAVTDKKPNWVELYAEEAGISMHYDANSVVLEDENKGVKTLALVFNTEEEQEGAHSALTQIKINCEDRLLQVNTYTMYDGFFGEGSVVGEAPGTKEPIHLGDEEESLLLVNQFCK